MELLNLAAILSSLLGLVGVLVQFILRSFREQSKVKALNEAELKLGSPKAFKSSSSEDVINVLIQLRHKDSGLTEKEIDILEHEIYKSYVRHLMDSRPSRQDDEPLEEHKPSNKLDYELA